MMTASTPVQAPDLYAAVRSGELERREAERRRNAERARQAQERAAEREREYGRQLLAAQQRGGVGAAHGKLDEYTPNVYLPTAQVLAALNELPDTIMSRYLGNEDAAARLEGQPVRALRASQSMRDIGEAVIGPEEILGSLNRLASGEGGGWDVFNVGATVLPVKAVREPIAAAARQFVVDPARRAYSGIRGAVSGAPEALAARPTTQITRQGIENPSVNVGLVVENDLSGTGRREQISPEAAQQALSDLGVNIERSQVRMSDTEPTLVAELDRALTPPEAFAVSEGLRQKAIAQVDPAAGGALHGPMAAEWGDFNPEYYLPFDQDAASFAVQRRADITDPANAASVYEMDNLRRQLFERDLIAGMTRPGGLRDEQAAALLEQLSPEAVARMRLAEMGADTLAMPEEWAASLAVPQRFDAGRAPSSAAGVHYGRIGGLTQTDPSFYGTGHRGEDFLPTRQRGGMNRTYFYVGPDGRPVVPEPEVARLAGNVYDADLLNMYDLNADPEQLAALARAHAGRDLLSGEGYKPVSPFYVYQGAELESPSAIPDIERLIRQYGYSGYVTDYGDQRAAAMFDPVNVRQR
jgi:hypothetical protein